MMRYHPSAGTQNAPSGRQWLWAAFVCSGFYLFLSVVSCRQQNASAATPNLTFSGVLANALLPTVLALSIAKAVFHTPLAALPHLLAWPNHSKSPLRTFFAFFLLGALLGPVFALFGTWVQDLLCSLFHLEAEMQNAVSAILAPTANPWVRLILILSIFTLIPLGEELSFRSLIFAGFQNGLAGRIPCAHGCAAVLGSLIFAAAHMDLLRFVPLFVLALCLCCAFRHKGLPASFGMHAGFNAANLVQIFLFS
ncbi:MAG: lysostaphin resistance A-like protein [Kiritimatiellia bacterium]